jgi:hypothetical protein
MLFKTISESVTMTLLTNKAKHLHCTNMMTTVYFSFSGLCVCWV